MSETEIVEKLIAETEAGLKAGYDFELRARLDWLQSLNGRPPPNQRACISHSQPRQMD